MSISNIKRFFPRITFLFLFLAIQAQAECNNKLIYPDSLHKNRLYTVIGLETGAYLSGLSYLRYIWYRNHERVPFHFYNDSKGYLQIDKASHALVTYYETSTTYHALWWSGLDKTKLYGMVEEQDFCFKYLLKYLTESMKVGGFRGAILQQIHSVHYYLYHRKHCLTSKLSE